MLKKSNNFHLCSRNFHEKIFRVLIYASLKVNNSTNIHKKEQPPLTFKNTRKTMRYGVDNRGPGLGQAQKCDSLHFALH